MATYWTRFGRDAPYRVTLVGRACGLNRYRSLDGAVQIIDNQDLFSTELDCLKQWKRDAQEWVSQSRKDYSTARDTLKTVKVKIREAKCGHSNASTK